MNKSTRIGTTYGLSRTSDQPGTELWSEQVYVKRIDEPLLIPHPDAGSRNFPAPGYLTPRTIRIVNGDGYRFTPVLDLTEQQAVEMAKVILEELDADQYQHPGRKWEVQKLRLKADNIHKALSEIADDLEKMK